MRDADVVVEIDDRGLVSRLEHFEEPQRRYLGLLEPLLLAHAVRRVEDDADPQRLVRRGETLHGLWDAVFGDLETVTGQIGDVTARAVPHDEIEIDQIHVLDLVDAERARADDRPALPPVGQVHHRLEPVAATLAARVPGGLPRWLGQHRERLGVHPNLHAIDRGTVREVDDQPDRLLAENRGQMVWLQEADRRIGSGGDGPRPEHAEYEAEPPRAAALPLTSSGRQTPPRLGCPHASNVPAPDGSVTRVGCARAGNDPLRGPRHVRVTTSAALRAR